MKDQSQRELLIKVAVNFGGLWPDVTGYRDCLIKSKSSGEIKVSILSSKDIHKNLNKIDFDFVCTRNEFEAFIDSLFEGAPDDAEYYLAPTGRTYPCWIKDLCADDDFCQYKVIIEDAMQSYTDKEWQRYNANKVIEGGVLIPRPRKKPSFVGDAIKRSIDQAYNEAINKVPNTPTMNDHFADTNVGEWIPEVGQEFEWMLEGVSDEWHESYFVGYDKEGDMVIQRDTEGLDGLNTTKANHSYKFRPLPKREPESWMPEVGEECEYKYKQYEHEYKTGTPKFIGDKLIIMESGFEQCYHIDSLDFRPLRTDAEIECERLYDSLCELDADLDDYQINCLIEFIQGRDNE